MFIVNLPTAKDNFAARCMLTCSLLQQAHKEGKGSHPGSFSTVARNYVRRVASKEIGQSFVVNFGVATGSLASLTKYTGQSIEQEHREITTWSDFLFLLAAVRDDDPKMVATRRVAARWRSASHILWVEAFPINKGGSPFEYF